MSKVIEGAVPYKGYKTYYKIVGEDKSGRPPLVMLRGGPGSTHFYLESYELMAERYGRQVVFYDQIGCGLSAIPHQEDDFYSYKLWMDELDAVREALGLDRIHLFGHSWGGKPAAPEALEVYMPEVEMDRSAESGNNVIEVLIDTHRADTLDELARKLGIPADALKASVERYNEPVDAGFDGDFGKRPACLARIDAPPFCGIRAATGGNLEPSKPVTDADVEAAGYNMEQLSGPVAAGTGKA